MYKATIKLKDGRKFVQRYTKPEQYHHVKKSLVGSGTISPLITEKTGKLYTKKKKTNATGFGLFG